MCCMVENSSISVGCEWGWGVVRENGVVGGFFMLKRELFSEVSDETRELAGDPDQKVGVGRYA
jgi:hypothetical protein